MAVFGVPQAHEDDALRAVRAAVELRAAVATIGLRARIGVNTGEVVAGEGDALVTGDAVNVAARLEQTARARRDPDRAGDPAARPGRGAGRARRAGAQGQERPGRGVSAAPDRLRVGRPGATPRLADRRSRARAPAFARRLRQRGVAALVATCSRCSGPRASASRGSSRSSSARPRIAHGSCAATASTTARASPTGRSSRCCSSWAPTPRGACPAVAERGRRRDPEAARGRGARNGRSSWSGTTSSGRSRRSST